MEGPLFGKISADWFVEWMEANAIFGAELVVIHNLSIGILQVLPWDLDIWPTDSDRRIIHNNLQPITIVDCQYRLQQYSKYVVFVDLDELIVPRHPSDKTWSDMIARLNCPLHPHSYGARQLWFIMHSPRVDNTSLVTQDVRTWLRTTASIHSVFKVSGNTTCVIPPEIGGLHHYRLTPAVTNTTQDDTMEKYKMELLQRVKRVKEAVEKI